jgi:hypothetical protein
MKKTKFEKVECEKAKSKQKSILGVYLNANIIMINVRIRHLLSLVIQPKCLEIFDYCQ